jgi:hypothetical protein
LATILGNAVAGAGLGGYGWANYAISVAEKRIAQINAQVGTTIDSGDIQFYTWNAGAVGERMRIMAAGNVGIGTVNAGSKLTVIPTVNPTTVATSNQIAIGEASNNSTYRLSLGFCLFSAYSGVIHATDAGAGSPLLLNPSGGNVGIGVTIPRVPLHVGSSAVSIPAPPAAGTFGGHGCR